MTNLCWIRRDLRLHDHAALSTALAEGPTLLAFIFDSNILEKLKDKSDRRVTFIYESLLEIEKTLKSKGSSLIIRYGKPEVEVPKICKEFNVNKVFTNRDYEPYAKNRDEQVAKKLKERGIEVRTFKDSVQYEKHELLTGSGTVYKVFSPYKKKWLESFEKSDKTVSNFECKLKNLHPITNKESLLSTDWYERIGFQENSSLLKGGTREALKRLKGFAEVIHDYKEGRNYPAREGTSLMSVYLRFGNISIRDLIRESVKEKNEGTSTWLNELIWRDFYQVILDAFPYVEHHAFKPQYDKIKWLGTKSDFKAWCEGQTGFPIIDAAMRCFNQTGMMHNRLRMIVASFLCKILLVDYRMGEKYFASGLLDYDLAANNGGWQWSSSSGCDAQPYFRIFNPYNQSEKFDKEGEFIRKWVPELRSASKKEIHRPDSLKFPDYPAPILSYENNRMKCLEMYSVVKGS